MIIREYSPTPCSKDQDTMDLFHSPEEDGRTEIRRDEREGLAGILCWTCPYRVQCVQKALRIKEPWGVWGGLGEGQRREFKIFLEEVMGHERKDVPTLSVAELQRGLAAYYATHSNPYQKFYSDEYEAPAPSRGDGP